MLVGDSVAPCTQAIDAVITQLQSQKTYTSRQRYLDVVTAQAAARILLCCAAHPHLTSSVFASFAPASVSLRFCFASASAPLHLETSLSAAGLF